MASNGISQEASGHLPTKHAQSPDATDAKFDEFWAAYPERHGNPKEPARLKFQAAIKAGADPDDIIRGARNYASFMQRDGKDSKYIAHAKTWLNEKRWNDYLRSPPPPKLRAGMV